MRDAGKPPPAFGEGMKTLVDKFVNGSRVTRKVWEGALGDLAAWGAHMVDQQAQTAQGSGATAHAGGFRPPPGFRTPPNWWPRGQPASPPPPDPKIEERRKARIVLGFGPSDPITLPILQRRRRDLARRHHPDRGGSVEKMKLVNAAADLLEAELKPPPPRA